MTGWEYARFYWHGSGTGDARWVAFTDGTGWEPIGKSDFTKTLKQLGDAGWELVGVAQIAYPAYSPQTLYFKRVLQYGHTAHSD